VPWHCPHCAARLTAASLEGTVSCPWCGSVVYAEEGDGIPHRIVSSCHTVDEIRRTARDCFRRLGRSCEPGKISIVYVPYYVFEGAAGAGPWTGQAAVGLPSADLLTIPIYGTDTSWFDPAALPPGANVMEASRSLWSIAGERRVLELRHVPIAHVAYEDDGQPGSLWIDADRARVLAGGPRPAIAAGKDHDLNRMLWIAAGAACFCGLVLPLPLSLLVAAGAVFALTLALAPGRRRRARPSP
jgi:hypothetical protein